MKITPARFSLDIPVKDMANGIYAGYRAETNNRGNELIFDADTRKHIEDAAKWLTDPKGKPGLLLKGKPGNGKTTLMRGIARLIAYVTEVELGYARRITPKHCTARDVNRISMNDNRAAEYDTLISAPILCLDELGEEATEVLKYGNVEMPVIDLLLTRYDKRRTTIITTNLTKERIKEKYGERVYDRLKEMMEVINFEQDSYRGRLKRIV